MPRVREEFVFGAMWVQSARTRHVSLLFVPFGRWMRGSSENLMLLSY